MIPSWTFCYHKIRPKGQNQPRGRSCNTTSRSEPHPTPHQFFAGRCKRLHDGSRKSCSPLPSAAGRARWRGTTQEGISLQIEALLTPLQPLTRPLWRCWDAIEAGSSPPLPHPLPPQCFQALSQTWQRISLTFPYNFPITCLLRTQRACSQQGGCCSRAWGQEPEILQPSRAWPRSHQHHSPNVEFFVLFFLFLFSFSGAAALFVFGRSFHGKEKGFLQRPVSAALPPSPWGWIQHCGLCQRTGKGFQGWKEGGGRDVNGLLAELLTSVSRDSLAPSLTPARKSCKTNPSGFYS